jgi:hypothetical protein
MVVDELRLSCFLLFIDCRLACFHVTKRERVRPELDKRTILVRPNLPVLLLLARTNRYLPSGTPAKLRPS